MTGWMKDWLGGLGIAVGVCGVLAIATLFVMAFLGNGVWADMLLEPRYSAPELGGAYSEVLAAQVRLAVLACVGVVFAGFLLWHVAMLLFRPTGPGQVRWGWRLLLWLTLFVAVCGAGCFMPYWMLAIQLFTVNGEAALRFAAALGLVAGVAYWLVSLMAAGRMMRPALPLGRLVSVR